MMKQDSTSTTYNATAKTVTFYKRTLFSALAFFFYMGTAYAENLQTCYRLLTGPFFKTMLVLDKVTIQQADQGEGNTVSCRYHVFFPLNVHRSNIRWNRIDT